MTKDSESDRKWVTLINAVRMVVRLGEDGDRLASLMTIPEWVLYDCPSSIEAMHGPEWVELFPLAKEAFNSAVSLLRELLPQNIIKGEGWHEDTHERGPITEPEWATRYIDFWKSELRHLPLDTRKEYPWITAVVIRANDVRVKCNERLLKPKRHRLLQVLAARIHELKSKPPAPPSDDEARALIRAASHVAMPSVNERKQGAVISAIRSIGIEHLAPLKQKVREDRIVSAVGESTGLKISGRYASKHYRTIRNEERS